MTSQSGFSQNLKGLFHLGAGWLVLSLIALPRLLHDWQKNETEAAASVALAFFLFFLLKGLAQQTSTGDQEKVPASAYCLIALSLVFLAGDFFLEEEFLLALGLWTGGLGSIGLILGSGVQRRVVFPFILALYAVPIPGQVLFYYFHHPLQIFSATACSGLLRLWGYSGQFSGTVISLGNGDLNIVEECSGLRFLTILSFFALLAGDKLFGQHLWKRFVLIMGSIPLALATNAFRLVWAGKIVETRNLESALEFLHGSSVLFFYCLSIALLMALGLFLKQISLSGSEEVIHA